VVVPGSAATAPGHMAPRAAAVPPSNRLSLPRRGRSIQRWKYVGISIWPVSHSRSERHRGTLGGVSRLPEVGCRRRCAVEASVCVRRGENALTPRPGSASRPALLVRPAVARWRGGGGREQHGTDRKGHSATTVADPAGPCAGRAMSGMTDFRFLNRREINGWSGRVERALPIVRCEDAAAHRGAPRHA
jgi:hypothetical protein